MKEDFIKSVTGDFIIRRDFMPLKDEAGNLLTGDIVNVLLKQSFASVVILELIDADRLMPENISTLLGNNAKRLESMNVPQCCLFEVFIFNAGPDERKLEIIKEGQLQEPMSKKYIGCMTVNLGAGTVEKHFRAPAVDFAIERTIRARLSDKSSNLPYEGRIEDIIRKREEDKRVSFRAGTPYLTYGLIAVNIIVFGLLYLYSSQTGISYNNLLYYFGSKVNSNIINGEYWRLVTPIFLHANEVHLLINCYSLYIVGINVEKIFGHARFAVIYLFAGILGNIFSFMFSIYPAVGASGAIFGLLGALLFFGLERPALFRASFGYGVISTIVINLAYGFSNTGIDNYAHMGGLLGGFLGSGIVNASTAGKWYLNRFPYLFLAAVITAAGLFYGFSKG